VPTEDVLYLCELLGIEHGVDIRKVIEAGDFISKVLNRTNLSSVTLADLDLIEERKKEVMRHIKLT
jgi:hypothetical protein